ncbi:hypothetical protein [Streptomyces sp. NPDC050355]|uniref:hypothetical protein n=1 Tax=Streptomyces sp. NPDC050355 TaxID=3365609 RepID=UPI00378F7B2D
MTTGAACTGELLSTVKFMVQTLAAAGELQRELTYDGLRAAEAKGNKGGRRPVLAGDTVTDVRAAYLEGQSIAALGREYSVSSSPAASRSTAPRASLRSRHSARPAVSTRTGSAHSQADHDRS